MSDVSKAIEAQLNNLLQRKLAEIPPDIMQKAEEAYTASLHDSMAGKADYLKHVALAIMAERERHSDLLDALKNMLPEANRADQHLRPNFKTCEEARAAIAKAEGRSDD